MFNTREIAAQILTEIYLKFEFFETAVLLSKNFSRLNQRDKAFVRYLVLNTLRRNGQVDKVLNDYVKIPIKKKSTMLISRFYKLLKGRIKIIGVGGVDSGESAYEKFLAGANYVQLYTGMVFRGPNIVSMIKKELRELLLKDGVKNFSEIVGNKSLR